MVGIDDLDELLQLGKQTIEMAAQLVGGVEARIVHLGELGHRVVERGEVDRSERFDGAHRDG